MWHKIEDIWNLPEHSTLASSTWLQVFSPHGFALHSVRDPSVPLQFMSLSQIWPFPSPYFDSWGADSAVPQPRCLHTTLASRKSQPSSHTVPQVSLWSTSTLPEQLFGPSTRRISSLVVSTSSGKNKHPRMKIGNEKEGCSSPEGCPYCQTRGNKSPVYPSVRDLWCLGTWFWVGNGQMLQVPLWPKVHFEKQIAGLIFNHNWRSVATPKLPQHSSSVWVCPWLRPTSPNRHCYKALG